MGLDQDGRRWKRIPGVVKVGWGGLSYLIPLWVSWMQSGVQECTKKGGEAVCIKFPPDGIQWPDCQDVPLSLCPVKYLHLWLVVVAEKIGKNRKMVFF